MDHHSEVCDIFAEKPAPHMKVLIVDDEELDLFISKTLLGTVYEVTGFSDTKKAVAWATTNDFDVALIDYYLGQDIHASDVLKELVAVKGKTFKAFVVSSYVDDRQVKTLKELGFNDVIFKPISLDNIKQRLS